MSNSQIDTSLGLKVLEIDDLRARVTSQVFDTISTHAKFMNDLNPDLAFLTDSLGQMMTGGKRLRPAFAYWGFRAAGGTDSPEILQAATALEFLQACALIHDDLMDESDTRH